MTTTQPEVKQLVEMDRATMLKKLDTAQKAIAELSWAFPSEDALCVQLVALEQGIFAVQDKMAEGN